jgi:transcriptional regulator with XRE-family HTH domain
MTNFANFLTINGLKRKDIATFLGVSGAFITQIASGDRPLPEEKLALIKANANNWDISMLTKPETAPKESPIIENTFVEYLKSEIENLKSLVSQLQDEKADLLKENAVLEYQLMMMSPKGEKSARNADGSLSADAV